MLIRNQKAPKGLFDGIVFDGSLAGVHRGSTYYHDASGLGNNGTLTGMDPATDWVWSPELQRWALDFDGSNDYVQTTWKVNSAVVGTIAWWQRPNTAYNSGTARGIWSQDSGGTPWFDSQIYAGNNYWYVGFNRSGKDSRVTIAATATNWRQYQWDHYAFTWEHGGYSRLFQNGQQIGVNGGNTEVNSPSNAMRFGVQVLYLGHVWFAGQQSDQLIYNRALTPPEISWLASPANHLRVPWRRTVFPSAVAPLTLPDYPDVENESPYADDESIVTVAATGGSAPVSYSIEAQSTTAGMLKVTGTLNPDATGIYVENGTYNGKPAYERADGAYWIWWYNGITEFWTCSAAKGSFGDSYWRLVIDQSLHLLGEYSPVGTATGTATVAAYAPYAINSSTGEITITDPSGLAVGQTWSLTVRATDALLDTDDGTVTVELVAAGTFSPAWARNCNNLIGAGI